MSETTQSDQPHRISVRGRPIGFRRRHETEFEERRRPVRLRRTRLGILIAAGTVSVLAVLLVLAAWRDDTLIDSNKGVTSGEVLSAGRLRSAVTYVTPDGVTHNPKVGVLYPTKLTAGERINVEYSKKDPELVRVAGRDARVAIIPAFSVIVVAWALALPVLWILGRLGRRPKSSPDLRVGFTSPWRRRVSG